ncbi:MAG: glycosyltransferase [Porticoccaceae bacterium]|nr:glycosyltransferase [Porticoccaceae bacterium]
MILITNKVRREDWFSHKLLSLAGLVYQEKLSEFCCPTLEISLVPSFVSLNYRNDKGSKNIFINTIKVRGTITKMFKYVVDSLYSYILISRSKDNAVLFYNVDAHNIVLVYCLIYLSRKKCVAVIADNSFVSWGFFSKLCNYAISRLDGVIVLNNTVVNNSNSVLMPGLLRNVDFKSPVKKRITPITLFSGSLGKTTGFEICLETMVSMPEITLNVSGRPYFYSDDDFSAILEKYSGNKNIVFHGILSEHQYADLLSSADIAFSLRNPDDLEHDHNFPSKILEYLAAGKMVISTKKYGFIPEGILFYTAYSCEGIGSMVGKLLLYSESQVYAHQQRVLEFLKSNCSKKVFQTNLRLLVGSNETT